MNGFLVVIPGAHVAWFAARAALALALGAAIGLERQWRKRTAGLRTNALVALGAALFELLAVQGPDWLRSPPSCGATDVTILRWKPRSAG